MSISIIIPVYNRADIVADTLRSVASQTYRHIHLILVDNNSSDSTLTVLHNFKQQHQADDFHITVLQEKQPGAAAARNCGLRAADTDWVMFFDSDDIMQPDLVESYAKAINANPYADIIVTRVTNEMLNGSIRDLPYFESDIFANHIIHCTLSTIRYIARRERFVEVGAWDCTQKIWDDYELGVRLLLRMPTIAFVGDKSRITIKSRESSISGTDFSSRHKLCEYALDTIEHHISQSMHLQRERLLKLTDYRRVVLAAHYQSEGHADLARQLYGKVIRRYTSSPLISTLFAAAYTYISHGGRGFGRLIRLIVR